MITVKEVTTDKKGLKDFINLQYDLYRDEPNFVPPLRIERNIFFNQKKNPFFEHAQGAYFVAYGGEKAVGRITAHTDENYDKYHNCKQGFFGFYESENSAEVCRELCSSAEKWLLARGVRNILGPMNFSTNHETPGFMVKGFDTPPILMMPYTKKYYPDLFKALGYTKAQLLIAYDLHDVKKVPDVVSDYYKKFTEKYGDEVTIRHLDMKNLNADVRIILDIFNEAWCNNWGYVPMTDKEIDQMASELKLIVNPAVTYLLFKNGEPAAFQLAMPNINEILIKIKDGRLTPAALYKLLFWRNRIHYIRVLLMGIRPKFRRLGLDFIMYYHIFNDGLQKTQYRSVEMSWLLESNTMINAVMKRLDADPYKEYLIVSKELGEN